MCQHLQVVPADVAREQAKLAREQAKADVAIAADKRAIEATQTTTEVTTDVPLLDLQSNPAMPVLHADISMQSTPAELPAQQKQSFYTSGRFFVEETALLQHGKSGNMVGNVAVSRAGGMRTRVAAADWPCMAVGEEQYRNVKAVEDAAPATGN